MKLELKHLAGYLPYGLKIRYIERNETHDLEYHNIMSICSEQNHLKPILRPLSDLTKNKFRNKFNEQSKHIECNFDSFSDFTTFFISQDYILSFPFDIIQWLIEKHFDIYGLIENGLAIDINTLNK